MIPAVKGYHQFLKQLDDCFDILPLKDHEKATEKTCLLRHDVDVDFEGALKMAQIEDELEIHSTYFIFYVGGYPGFAPYNVAEDFIETCLALQDMGHEVGVHNNVATRVSRSTTWSAKVFERELKALRSKGLKIHGVSNHGREENYLIFKECFSSRGMVAQPILSLKELGLYEACFLPIKQDGYLTDSRGSWRYLTGEEQNECHPNFSREVNDVENIIEFIGELGGREEVKIIQLLTHPCLWSL